MAGFPPALLAGPHQGGIVNLPAVIISFAVAGLLALGTKESATVNMVLVVIKIAALAIFVVLCLPAFDASHFTPFMPKGFAATAGADGVKVGVMAAASLIFFAFYGFDAVSTAAEETKNPRRDLTIGIVGSMLACTLIYMLVAAVAIGASRTEVFSRSEAPLVFILETLKHPKMAQLVALAAVVALPTVILAFMYGQSRIFFVMARDGLLPAGLAKVNAKTGTPVLMTLLTGALSAALSGLLSLKDIAELANAGTLAAFIAVGLSVIILRVRDPGRPRMFSTPLWQVVAPGAILGCLYLFYSLPAKTQLYFLYAHLIGAAVYFLYGVRRSALARAETGKV
jgi:APA family basic amino acid/polyamine antiporter